jgi:hypothetical protein
MPNMQPRTRAAPRPSYRTRQLFAALTLSCAAAFAAAAVDEAQPTRLEGAYEWSLQGDRGPLSVEFEPSADGAWRVSFRLHFRQRTLVYEGEATGSLGDGPLEGTVDDIRGRRYGFRGAFEQGVFRGEHFRLSRGGRERSTGSLTFE